MSINFDNVPNSVNVNRAQRALTAADINKDGKVTQEELLGLQDQLWDKTMQFSGNASMQSYLQNSIDTVNFLQENYDLIATNGFLTKTNLIAAAKKDGVNGTLTAAEIGSGTTPTPTPSSGIIPEVTSYTDADMAFAIQWRATHSNGGDMSFAQWNTAVSNSPVAANWNLTTAEKQKMFNEIAGADGTMSLTDTIKMLKFVDTNNDKATSSTEVAAAWTKVIGRDVTGGSNTSIIPATPTTISDADYSQAIAFRTSVSGGADIDRSQFVAYRSKLNEQLSTATPLTEADMGKLFDELAGSDGKINVTESVRLLKFLDSNGDRTIQNSELATQLKAFLNKNLTAASTPTPPPITEKKLEIKIGNTYTQFEATALNKVLAGGTLSDSEKRIAQDTLFDTIAAFKGKTEKDKFGKVLFDFNNDGVVSDADYTVARKLINGELTENQTTVAKAALQAVFNAFDKDRPIEQHRIDFYNVVNNLAGSDQKLTQTEWTAIQNDPVKAATIPRELRTIIDQNFTHIAKLDGDNTSISADDITLLAGWVRSDNDSRSISKLDLEAVRNLTGEAAYTPTELVKDTAIGVSNLKNYINVFHSGATEITAAQAKALVSSAGNPATKAILLGIAHLCEINNKPMKLSTLDAIATKRGTSDDLSLNDLGLAQVVDPGSFTAPKLNETATNGEAQVDYMKLICALNSKFPNSNGHYTGKQLRELDNADYAGGKNPNYHDFLNDLIHMSNMNHGTVTAAMLQEMAMYRDMNGTNERLISNGVDVKHGMQVLFNWEF